MTKSRKYLRAQTALELAVFGAILIFVVGVIIRQALSSAYMQNQNLRAMRHGHVDVLPVFDGADGR